MDCRLLFKLGFLLRCAEEGLTSEQTGDRMEKTAVGPGFYQIGKDLLDKGVQWASWPLLASLPVGFMAGNVAADIAAPADTDPEEIKKYELLEAYRRQTERARRTTNKIRYRMSQLTAPPRVPSTAMRLP